MITFSSILHNVRNSIPGLKRSGIILAYGPVSANGSKNATDPEEFERQMMHIKQRRYKVIPLSEMCERLRSGMPMGGLVALTFDDGYADFFKSAFPVLKRYNFPSTVFLITDKLGENLDAAGEKAPLRLMTDLDVKRAATTSALIEFMPQEKAGTDPAKPSAAEGAESAGDSRRSVEMLTKKPADIFSYARPVIADHLHKDTAWLAAVTREEGYVNAGDDAFRLKRIFINATVSFQKFKKYMSRV